jgi:uncharacterized phage-associated protein
VVRHQSSGPVGSNISSIYYAQGHHLAVFGQPLFQESISAWGHGPGRRRALVRGEARHPAGDAAALDEAALNSVGYVVSRYGRLSGRDLENLSHAEEPWRQADLSRKPGQSVRIERDWIAEYFSSAEADDDEIVLDARVVDEWLRGAGERASHDVRRDDLDRLRSLMRGN